MDRLLRRTGRCNIAQGALITAQGIGAAHSTTLAGLVVVLAGYRAAFLTLAGVAAAGLLLFWVAMPESKVERSSDERDIRGDQPEPLAVGAFLKLAAE